jgi:hypothetical protein
LLIVKLPNAAKSTIELPIFRTLVVPEEAT